MMRIKDARQQNKAEVGEKHISITPVAQKEVPYTIVMNKFDGRKTAERKSWVISDDEVDDPESSKSPVRSYGSREPQLRNPSAQHTPRGKLRQSEVGGI